MNTIYLCESVANVRRVFCDNAPVYSKKDLLENPGKFLDTTYIFSTWGMPEFTEEEIKTHLHPGQSTPGRSSPVPG